MKLRVTMIVEMEVEFESYPGARTIEDIARIQQKYFDDGISCRHEAIDCERVEIKVGPIYPAA